MHACTALYVCMYVSNYFYQLCGMYGRLEQHSRWLIDSLTDWMNWTRWMNNVLRLAWCNVSSTTFARSATSYLRLFFSFFSLLSVLMLLLFIETCQIEWNSLAYNVVAFPPQSIACTHIFMLRPYDIQLKMSCEIAADNDFDSREIIHFTISVVKIPSCFADVYMLRIITIFHIF